MFLLAFSWNVIAADSVNLGVTGNIIASPCVFNGGSANLDINLGNIQATNMATPGVARRNFSHRNALNYALQQTSEKPLLRTVQIKTPRSLSHSNDEAGNLR